MGSFAGSKRISLVLELLLALALANLFFVSTGSAQKPHPKLSKDDVIGLLEGNTSSDDIAKAAREEGISFQVTASVEKEIRGAGGTDELIRVLRSLAPHGSTPPPVVVTPHNTPSPTPPVLVIESNPGQSQVYVDDEPVGSTSAQGRLRLSRLTAGDHRVRIAQSGYQDHEESVTLAAGETATVAATLQKLEAQPIYTPPPQPKTEEPPVVNPVTPAQQQPGYLGVLPMQQQPSGTRGVVLSGAAPGGPADQAGLKPYDTILAVNGMMVASPQQLKQVLSSHQAGEVVQITWNNGSNTVTRAIRLVPYPAGGQTQQLPPPVPQPRAGFASFAVAHDHGQSGKDYCVGIMSIANGMVYYKSNNGVHSFEIPLNTIREARRNTVYLVALGAFHIRTKKNSNFNFVALNPQGQPSPPDAVLTAIDNATGR